MAHSKHEMFNGEAKGDTAWSRGCCREQVWDAVNSCEEASAPNHRCSSLSPSEHPSVRMCNITVHTATAHSNRADRMYVRQCVIHFDEEEGPLEDGSALPLEPS